MIWCECALSMEAVALWLREQGHAALAQDVQCGICFKPRLRLMQQGHPGYVVHVDDYVFEAEFDQGSPNAQQYMAEAMNDRWAAAQILGQPFRHLLFTTPPDHMNRVACCVTEIYSEFETAMFLGRQRQQLTVLDLAAQQPICIA